MIRTQHLIYINQSYCVIIPPLILMTGMNCWVLKASLFKLFLATSNYTQYFTSLGGELVGGEVIGGEISRWQDNRESPANSSHKGTSKIMRGQTLQFKPVWILGKTSHDDQNLCSVIFDKIVGCSHDGDTFLQQVLGTWPLCKSVLT